MSLLDRDDIKEYIRSVLEEWSIPTAAIAVIDLKRGTTDIRGYRINSVYETVDENTIWSICSNTKLFTVFSLACLVERGQLNWNDKLCDLVPGLQLKDDYANATVTLADSLSHQTGIPAYNDAYYPYHAVPSATIDILNNVEPTYRPLRKWMYNNAFYNLAAHIVAVKSGQNFTDFVTEHILLPLGMEKSYFGHAPEDSHVATPYLALKGSPPREGGYGFHNVPDNWIGAGAGGLLCSAGDIALWISYLLRLATNKLRPEDPHIIKTETYREIMRARCFTEDTFFAFPSVPGESAFREISPNAYALGLWRCQYRGFDIAYHAGTGPGAGSVILTMPERELALAILTPVASGLSKPISAIVLKLLDDYLDLEPVDWLGPYAQAEKCRKLHS